MGGHSPFDRKDILKARGYRWSNGEDGAPKAWWIEVDASNLEAEIRYLQTDIYSRSDMGPTLQHLTAVDRVRG